MSEGKKNDSGKEMLHLLPSGPLFDLARVYEFGLQKYGQDNWRQGFPWSRIYSAALRHMMQFWNGEDLDSESGLNHLSHAMWNICTLLSLVTTHPHLDDRWKGNQND